MPTTNPKFTSSLTPFDPKFLFEEPQQHRNREKPSTTQDQREHTFPQPYQAMYSAARGKRGKDEPRIYDKIASRVATPMLVALSSR
ncbi:hypothetical protein RRF57_013191 [Xylaria bambusicola]|uniref:Uncharacterized protein n=1 Tax=Xylaria bambusicola TaxID=326684 RepID=A0AAN7ZE38_9PEZI